jgi:hypothetical protein
MDKRKIVVLVILTGLSFWFCQKKLFKKVQGHGRVLNYITKEPISCNIDVTSTSATTSKDVPHVNLISTSSASDGTFNFKTKASKSNDYYVKFNLDNDYSPEYGISLKDGKDSDLGDILTGKFTFSCNITLISVSSSTLTILYTQNGNVEFPPGSTTQFMSKVTWNKEFYKDQNGLFPIQCLLDGSSSTYSLIQIPINGPSVLNYTINY